MARELFFNLSVVFLMSHTTDNAATHAFHVSIYISSSTQREEREERGERERGKEEREEEEDDQSTGMSESCFIPGGGEGRVSVREERERAGEGGGMKVIGGEYTV